MIRDEDLKKATDYSEGQKAAAYMDTINSYPGGVRKIAEDFMPYVEAKLVQSMCQKLSEKFASTQHAGPVDVAAFLGVTDKDEKERVKQDVYQKVRYLVERLTK